MTTWISRRAVRNYSFSATSGFVLTYILTNHTVPTKVVQWKADYDFVPLNATEFLDPKVQTKWESLYPGLFITVMRCPAGVMEY